MEILRNSVVVVLLFLQFSFAAISANGSHERKTYIVYMGEVPEINLSAEEHHHNILTEAIGDEATARESRIHSYGKSLYGFVAKLLPNEAAKLRERDDVVSVFVSGKRELLTTRSWDFLGFTEKAVKRNLQIESNMIIGMLDSGIEMGAPSFDDKGYGPPPAKWKGKCQTGTNFTGCNNKVIGARWYNLDDADSSMCATPYDTDGHGSHTSSTAAGNPVRGASLYGIGRGTARGGVPSARIAVYKVCGDESGCYDANLLAGFDDAIADGVDVISASLGSKISNYMQDTIAIGSFHAMKKGIPTVMAAGNYGPTQGTVANAAPWGFTVTATDTDRDFVTKVKLGNGEVIDGISINPFATMNTMTPLISGWQTQDPSKTDAWSNATWCLTSGMIKEKVKGKIVMCYKGSDSAMQGIGAAGIIQYSDEITDIDHAHSNVIPASYISSDAANRIDRYIKSTKNPTAMIYRTIEPRTRVSPIVSSSASRGPAFQTRHILKPDIAAPGTDILAAWSKQPSMSKQDSDPRHVYFNIASGTSIATPHVAGAIAYVKCFHPEWSPAAIKSAIMTTAKPVNGDGIENPLNSGSGLIDPLRAVHPGLVYDMGPTDYFPYLCNEGYNTAAIRLISGIRAKRCSDYLPAPGTDGINNYPSMHMHYPIEESTVSAVFYRTVTYVGYGESEFEAKVKAPPEMSVKVSPSTMSFNRTREEFKFKVEVSATFTEEKSNYLIAFLEWTSGSKYSVRSPIVLIRPEV